MTDMLGAYLKRVRTQRGLTLRVVEEKTGISNAYLSQVENGKIVKPSPSILHKLAQYYDISYEYLLALAGHPLPDRDAKAPVFRISNDLLELSEEDRDMVLDYVRFLKSRKMKQR